MRRCRKQTDSFTFLKRSPSLVKKILPTPSQCRTVQKKLIGVKMDTTKEPSICSITPGAPCCNDPECTCPEKILLQQLRSRSSPLFCTIAQQGIPDIQKSPFTPDMLITGFGLRNLSSMQQALLAQRMGDKESVEEEYYGSITDFDKSTSSQTEITLTSSASTVEIEQKKKKLEYFMGITATMDEAEEEKAEEEVSKYVQFEEVPSEEIFTGDTESMRQAQKYLRVHRIFEFFQFLIAHLLSAIPDNPIEFLIELLEKCLIYRSGIGEPPLLYRRPHIGQLFYLMDRMETGYISLTQYSTGMKTLGICNYMANPPSTKDGLVAREFFIDEA
ncbi:uncharacterized protein LOC108740725 isoform X2 [Agrilus planipennis]|nr:uncharacterized protein LOC108740725 isoform X2 [Agrilus planipennis]